MSGSNMEQHYNNLSYVENLATLAGAGLAAMASPKTNTNLYLSLTAAGSSILTSRLLDSSCLYEVDEVV